MAKSKKKKAKKLTMHDKMADVICPTCAKAVEGHRCRLCGATKTINSVSGSVIWMRNGKLVAAFHDDKRAFVDTALEHNIPIEEWPEQFR